MFNVQVKTEQTTRTTTRIDLLLGYMSTIVIQLSLQMPDEMYRNSTKQHPISPRLNAVARGRTAWLAIGPLEMKSCLARRSAVSLPLQCSCCSHHKQLRAPRQLMGAGNSHLQHVQASQVPLGYVSKAMRAASGRRRRREAFRRVWP